MQEEKPKRSVSNPHLKRTPERLEKILAAVRQGVTLTTAAKLAGMHVGTLGEWRRSDPAVDAEVKKAVAESEVALVQTVQTAAQKQWQAAAWLLERRWPERWARRDIVIDVSKMKNKFDLSALSTEELEALIRALEKAHRADREGGHSTNQLQ
jgi:hypothetical protein